MTLYRKTIGAEGERFAIEFLRSKGFRILETNFRCKLGEIDIVAHKNSTLHCIEVKTRIGLQKGAPHEAITRSKLRHMIRTAEYYLRFRKRDSFKLSLDVVSIVLNNKRRIETIRLYENITM